MTNYCEREPFSFEETCKPSASGFSVEGSHRRELPLSDLSRGLDFEISGQNVGKRPVRGLSVNALSSQFLLDPAPAKSAESYPALRPLVRELFIVDVSEPNQIG